MNEVLKITVMKNTNCFIVDPGEYVRQAILELNPGAEPTEIRIGGVSHKHCWHSDTDEAREIWSSAKEQGKQHQFKVAVPCEKGDYRFLLEDEWIPATNRRRNLSERVRGNLELAQGSKLK